MGHAFTQEITNLFVMNNYGTLMLTAQWISLYLMFIYLNYLYIILY